jgi:hypothetical protein
MIRDVAAGNWEVPRLIAFMVACPLDNGDIPSDPENSRTVVARTLVSWLNEDRTEAASCDGGKTDVLKTVKELI